MKYPDDFQGWLPLGYILDGKYLVLNKPDHKYQALINVKTGDACEVMEMKTGGAVYSDPDRLSAAKAVLMMMNIENWAFYNYKKT